MLACYIYNQLNFRPVNRNTQPPSLGVNVAEKTRILHAVRTYSRKITQSLDTFYTER
jgi:hypothetical protein